MNGDLQLKLQAWVDGELSAEEAREVECLVVSDADATALVGELRMTREVLKGNETLRAVPESREFYWSAIRRGIEREEAAVAPSVSLLKSVVGAFRRFMLPAAGMATVMLLAALSVKFFGGGSLEDAALQMVEVENLSEEMGSISYRSQSDNMFVVYLYAKDHEGSKEESEAEPEMLEDLLFQ